MKNYDVCYTKGNPDWDRIPSVQLEQHLWSNVPDIYPQAQMAWDENALYVRLSAKEKNILRRFTHPLDSVCCDSCLEFFFCPDKDDRYFNFEFNPNGVVYAGYGLAGEMRYRLYESYLAENLQIKTFDLEGGWGVEFQVPVSFIQIFTPNFRLASGMKLRANFYKCGDETVEPHYIAWSPIDLPTPCYHCPEFFGTITLK